MANRRQESETGADYAAAPAEGADENANEARLEAAVRAAQARSAEDHAALARVRRKLTRLMLVSLTVTFIALAVVAIAIIYKITHTVSAAKSAAQAQTAAQARLRESAGAASPFIQTAPNSGAEAYFAREKQQAEAEAAKAAAETARNLPLRPGEKLAGAQLSGDLLLLRLAAADGASARLVIYDYRRGKVLAVFNTAAPAP